MAVSLDKAYVTPTEGGMWPLKFTLDKHGHVPEWLLAQRRREMHGVHITWEQAYDLKWGDLLTLQRLFARKYRTQSIG